MNEVLWRDSGIAPKIGPIDARAIFPLGIWLFHWAYWTAAIAGASMLILYLVQRTGMTPMACLRFLRLKVIGNRRETMVNERQWRKRSRW